MSFGGTLCELEGRGRAVGVGFDQFGLGHLNAGSEVERMEPFPTLVRTGLHGSQTDNTRDVLAGVSIRTTLIEDVLRMSALRETHHGSGELVTRLHCLQHIADNGGSHSCAVRNAGILGGIHEMKHPMHEAAMHDKTPAPTLPRGPHPRDSRLLASTRIQFATCGSSTGTRFPRPNSAADHTLPEYRAAIDDAMSAGSIPVVQAQRDM